MVLSFVFAVSYRAAPVSAATPVLSPGRDGIVPFVLLHHRRRDRDPARRRYGARAVFFSIGHGAAPPSVATPMPSSGGDGVASFIFLHSRRRDRAPEYLRYGSGLRLLFLLVRIQGRAADGSDSDAAIWR